MLLMSVFTKKRYRITSSQFDVLRGTYVRSCAKHIYKTKQSMLQSKRHKSSSPARPYYGMWVNFVNLREEE